MATKAPNERRNSVMKTATREGDIHMKTNHEPSVMKESNMKITPSNLIRWTGLAAIMAGIIFAGYQPIQPPEVLSSVTTSAWAIITPLKTAMCLLFLLGWTGLYARQVKEVGWLGLAGFLLLSLSWALQMAFVFATAFILPLLATTAPTFVDGVLRSASGHREWREPRSHPNALYPRRDRVYPRRPPLWHRDAARWHPATLGGWSACRRVRATHRIHVAPHCCPDPSLYPAFSSDAGGSSCSVVGLCALVRTARASLGILTCQGKPRVPSNRSQVSSLETARNGQAVVWPLVSSVTRVNPIRLLREASNTELNPAT